MLNGKFYAGLPPKMIERQSNGPNRQQSHFFWPDDSQAEPAVPPRARRASSNINAAVPNNKREQQNVVEPTKLFMNEFNKSKIHFYDVPAKGALPEGKSISSSGNKSKSQIQFYDYAGDELKNNSHQSVVVSVEERNLKSEVEKNLKNSPKLQDKKLDDHIKIITNDVKNIKKILKPSNTAKAKLRGDVMEGYEQKSNRRIHYKDEVDDRYDYDNEESTQFYPKSPLPRHRFRSRLDETAEEIQTTKTIAPVVEIPPSPPTNNQQIRTQRTTTSSHKHLVSNINFRSTSDSNSGYNNETIIMPARRNVRSSAVTRVSVGLPEGN